MERAEVKAGDIYLRDGTWWAFYRVERVTRKMAFVHECSERGRRLKGHKARTMRQSTLLGGDFMLYGSTV